jgi:poly(A) polymerase
VAFTDAEHDARRRDFTINGLFMDPTDGTVIDYVGGQEDIGARRLRAIGEPDERFNEDHLRLLRAVRFAARFDLTIEKRTAEAIRRHAPKIVRIAPERIAEELRRMLSPVTRNLAWPMLWEFALVDQVFRFLPVAAEEAEFDRAKSVFLAVSPGETIPFAMALAAASLDYIVQATGNRDLRDVVSPKTVQQVGKALRQSLRISNDELEDMVGTLMAIGPLVQQPPPAVAAMKRFLAKPWARGAWEIMEAVDQVAGTGGRVEWLRGRLEELSHGDVAPVPLITGDDLTDEGMKPGPVFKRVLEAAYDAQLEGRVSTKDEAMDLARQVAKDAPRTRGG